MNTSKFSFPFRAAANFFLGRLSLTNSSTKYAVGRLASTGCGGAGSALVNTPKIELADGKILYLLISIYVHGETLFARTIIRGAKAKQHLNLYDRVKARMNEVGLCTKALGGGMMDIDSGERKIKIYGKCKTFGRANHHKTKRMLKSSKKYRKFKISVYK